MNLYKTNNLVFVLIFLHCNIFGQTFEWFKSNGNEGYNVANSMTSLQSNIVHGGWMAYSLIFNEDSLKTNGEVDGYLSILDSDGNYVKSINWGGSYFDATDFIVSDNGSIIFSGQTRSRNFEILGEQFQKNRGGSATFIAKISDNLSNLEWISDFENGSGEFNNSLSVADTLINSAGFYNGFKTRTYNTSGELLWEIKFPTSNSVKSFIDSINIFVVIDSFDVQQNNDGSLQGGIYKHQLLKYDYLGNLIDKADIINYSPPSLGSDNILHIGSITTDNKGNVFISGSFEDEIIFDNVIFNSGNTPKGFIAKFDETLSPKWFKILGDSLFSSVNSLAISDNFYYVGWIERESLRGKVPNYYLFKYDEFGDLKMSLKLNSTHSISGFSSVIHNDDIYISGLFKGDININEITYKSSGVFDIFVCKIKKDFATYLNKEPDIVYKQINGFPNPVENYLLIESKEIIEQVIVFNINGQKIKSYRNITSNSFQLDMSYLEKGSYVIAIGKENHTIKVIKN